MKSSTIILMMAATTKALNMGVELYEHAEFNSDGVGWHGAFGPGLHNGDFPNDVVTSYKIDEGCCATFYEHYDYLGQSFAECGLKASGVPEGWNDVISSMKVECTKGGKTDYGSGELMLDQDTRSFLDELEKQHMEELKKEAAALIGAE